MTRSERFAASTEQVSPLPIPLPLQNEVVDERRLLTVPWVSLFQWILNIGTRTFLTGTHADRIDEKNDPAQFRPGTWFWETDRTVLYQVRIVPVVPATVPPTVAPQWVYVLGTMKAAKTLRPADLGTYDAGFQFAATDTGQLYLWNGTAWVDITAYPVTRYGTHAQRLAYATATLTDGALWCETDRGNVLYQLQNGVWWYIAGTMFGTLSPDQRPTDLGVRDAGFDFRSTVPPPQEFLWSQTAWVEVSSASGDVQHVNSTASLTLTATAAAVPGTTITLARAGRYLISGNFTFVVFGTGDFNVGLRGDMAANGVAQPGQVLLTCPTANTYIATSQMWVYQAPAAGHTVLLRAWKDAGATGTSQALGGFTSITALWVSP